MCVLVGNIEDEKVDSFGEEVVLELGLLDEAGVVGH